jgi:hypothetical protein
MQMKQTAVEWFEKNISKYISYHYDKSYEENDDVTKIFEQALEMEKEQIIDANRDGVDMVVDKKDFISGEQYYNETYNKQ